MLRNASDFNSLYRVNLNFENEGEWDKYYAKMIPYLCHADPTIRRRCLERLTTAVFHSEATGPLD